MSGLETCGAGQCAEVEEVSPVSIRINEIGHHIVRLRDRIDRLYRKASPVLAPDNPPDCGGQNKDLPNSPLCLTLDGLLAAASIEIDRLDDINNRIEL